MPWQQTSAPASVAELSPCATFAVSSPSRSVLVALSPVAASDTNQWYANFALGGRTQVWPFSSPYSSCFSPVALPPRRRKDTPPPRGRYYLSPVGVVLKTACHVFTRLKTSLNLAPFRVRAKFEPLSTPLQRSLRLVRHPLPACPTVFLTDPLPCANKANNRAYRVPL